MSEKARIDTALGRAIYSGGDNPTSREFIALISDKLRIKSYLGEKVE